MGEFMFGKRKITFISVIAILCIAVTLTSSELPARTLALSSEAEQAVVGGNNCNDYFGGFSLGMGLATLLGCAWCPAGAVGAKIAELLVC
jgi:hypothetical protein